ncbi:MAG: hypothetical protein FWC32_14140 [Firmicutes bacterium]|nr:hypothetical protein [Bacillota bacterium]
MNNDVKILSLLEELKQGQAELRVEVNTIKEDLAVVKDELAVNKKDFITFREETNSNFAELRTETRILRDNQLTDYQLLQKVDKKLDNMSVTVSVHDQKFKRMKAAL